MSDLYNLISPKKKYTHQNKCLHSGHSTSIFQATDYKMASCTSHVLNNDWGVFGTCETYYAGLTSTTPSLAHVTGEDIQKHCQTLKHNWTASEVNKYCSILVNAQNKYWTDKNIPCIPKPYQHKY